MAKDKNNKVKNNKPNNNPAINNDQLGENASEILNDSYSNKKNKNKK